MQLTTQKAAIIIAGYVATAVISTMPPKGCEWNRDTLYSWLFDCAHMLLNSRPTKAGS